MPLQPPRPLGTPRSLLLQPVPLECREPLSRYVGGPRRPLVGVNSWILEVVWAKNGKSTVRTIAGVHSITDAAGQTKPPRQGTEPFADIAATREALRFERKYAYVPFGRALRFGPTRRHPVNTRNLPKHIYGPGRQKFRGRDFYLLRSTLKPRRAGLRKSSSRSDITVYNSP